jgi:hypothetical protein
VPFDTRPSYRDALWICDEKFTDTGGDRVDREAAQTLVAALFAPEREAATYRVETDDGVLDVVRAQRGGPVTLTLQGPAAEPAAPDLARAWLESTWLRRLHDGIVAAADPEGRLRFALVLPDERASVEGIEVAVAALAAAVRRESAPSSPEATEFDGGLVWVRL